MLQTVVNPVTKRTRVIVVALGRMNERAINVGQPICVKDAMQRTAQVARPRFQPCLDASHLVGDGSFPILVYSIIPVSAMRKQWRSTVLGIISMYWYKISRI